MWDDFDGGGDSDIWDWFLLSWLLDGSYSSNSKINWKALFIFIVVVILCISLYLYFTSTP